MLKRAHIVELWNRLTDVYGHRWVSGHGTTDDEGTWFRGLRDLSPNELAAGLRRCIQVGNERSRTGDEDWPPSLGEFRAYCRRDKAVPYHSPYTALPKPELSNEQQQQIVSTIENCRHMLHRGAR